jgi:hypothetical protein
LISGLGNGKMIFWDLELGSELKIIDLPIGGINGIIHLVDHTLIAFGKSYFIPLDT